jgi:hypothetical protein
MLIAYATMLVLGWLSGLVVVLVALVAIVVAWSAIIGVSVVFHQIDARKRGYRLRCLDAKIRARIFGVKRGDRSNWVYEERASQGNNREMHFAREIIANGYPAANEVCVPSEQHWDDAVPSWARNRRSEILGRIAERFGNKTIFVERH